MANSPNSRKYLLIGLISAISLVCLSLSASDNPKNVTHIDHMVILDYACDDHFVLSNPSPVFVLPSNYSIYPLPYKTRYQCYLDAFGTSGLNSKAKYEDGWKKTKNDLLNKNKRSRSNC